MNVLSLFDGISAGQLALQRANIKVDNYYASEIDKYAIQVTQKNFPNTIQLGDVTKWEEWDLSNIDMIIGGSPCQGFSFAGKQLNFEDLRSKLFFEFVKILKHYKPKYFLLENVKMKKEFQNVITELFGVEPIEINSTLVSAQNRKRLYWTNIPNVKQPKDKLIYLQDILQFDLTEKQKSFCIDANYYKKGNLKSYFDKSRRQIVFPASIVGRRINERGVRDDYNKNVPITQCLQVKHSNYKMGCLTTVQKDNVLSTLPPGRYIDVYNNENLHYRHLTPIECERLQTFPDNFTEGISNSQRYKALGNSWTVDVVAHIFNNL